MPLSCCNCCSGRPARSPRRLRPADVPRPREPELQPEPEPELGESGAAAGTRVPSRPSRRLSVCRSLSALSLSLGLPVLTCLCASSGGAGEQKVSWVKMAREGYGEVLVSPSFPLSLPFPLSLSLSLSLSVLLSQWVRIGSSVGQRDRPTATYEVPDLAARAEAAAPGRLARDAH
eukprot:COSAG03_NODE_5676_length_1197_cov_1.798725_1_plen_174_part_01